MNKKKVVVVGGGTGTYNLLQGLKLYKDEIEITAIVTMADDGGSTGRLRDHFGLLPVGDIRQSLAALSAEDNEEEQLLRKLFLYRYDKGEEGLRGHNFGNLFLTALTEITGSEKDAIKAASSLLRICGQVVPVTTENAKLVARYTNGTEVIGEHNIDTQNVCLGEGIDSLRLEPVVKMNIDAEVAIVEADVIIFGPGDLYTSILANCVVRGFKEAVLESRAKLVYILNLMTKKCQTDGLDGVGHVAELEKYLGRKLDSILVNSENFPPEVVTKYIEEGERPVVHSPLIGEERFVFLPLLQKYLVEGLAGDSLKRSYIRHDGAALAKYIREYCR